MIRQPRYRPSATPVDVGLPFRPLRLFTKDHVEISGWLIPHRTPRGVLIMLHGFGTSKADLLDVARDLSRTGPFHLLLVDLRGHGFSGGKNLSFGKKEVLDIEAVLQFLRQDPALAHLPVGCYGISMGGAISILAAAQLDQIRAVASDSSYARLGGAIARVQWLTYHIPRVPLGQLVLWMVAARLGCRLSEVSPLSAVGKLSPRPILLIHGLADRSIPEENARLLFAKARDPKELWLVPGAEHVGCFFVDAAGYCKRIVRFFDDAFQGKAPASSGR